MISHRGPSEDDAIEAFREGKAARRKGVLRSAYPYPSRNWMDGWACEDAWINNGGSEGFKRDLKRKIARIPEPPR